MDTNPEFHDVNGDMRLYVARTPAQFDELLGYDPATDSFNASLHARRERQTRSQIRPHDGEEALFPFTLPGKSLAIRSLVYDGQGSYKTYRINYAQRKEGADALTGIYLVPAHPGATNIIARESDAPATPNLEKAALGVSYADVFRHAATDTFLSNREPFDNWDAQTARELADIASRIKAAHGNTRFFGIGNSPSYIIYAIKHLAQHDGTKVHAEYVPFSNRFLEQIPEKGTDDAAVYSFKYNNAQMMSARNRDNYRNFLDDLGLNPLDIVARHQTTGERTAIMDNIQGGGSFVSFIFFMHDWARELSLGPAFSVALDCIAVTQKPIAPAIAVPEAGLRVPVQSFAISRPLRKALNGNDNNKDRFVPAYAPGEWDSPPKSVPAENLHSVETVKAKIRQAIGELQPAVRTRFSQVKPQPSEEIPMPPSFRLSLLVRLQPSRMAMRA